MKMNNIKYLPLTKCLECVVDNRGKTVPTSDSGIPLIATNCIKMDSVFPVFEKIRYITKETYDTWFRSHLKPNDILFVNKGTPGKVALCPNPLNFVIAQDAMGLRANNAIVYWKYLYYYLKSDNVQTTILNNNVGLIIPHFKKEFLDRIIIPILPMEKQKKIGDLLYDMDMQIERNNAMCQKLQDLILTKYSVNYTQNKENGLLKDICSLPSGYSFKPAMYVPNGKYKLVTIKNVSNLFVDTTKVDYIDSLPKNLKDYCILSEGDILMSLTGNVGRISIVFEKNDLLNQRVSLIQADKNYKTYIYALLLSQKYQSIMQNLARGTSQKNLSPIDVENLQIYIPTNIVSFYENTINYFDEMISIQKATYKLSLLKENLLPLLINGQLVV